eukprot:TRINITY_DN30944_c0_g1_i1.p1 TRINITY_DN30944_c0_g1~~TRINITY_DN30944_c0_g1_i1.p1  ORF type:complete len:247 (-),score=35.39 TRINITY_DN30944_c0_g1_i1:84-773(-)
MVVENVATALLNLSLESELRVSLGTEVCVRSLVGLLTSQSATSVACDSAIGALCNLSTVEANRSGIIASGVIPTLIDTVRSDAPIRTLQEATRTLFNLSLDLTGRLEAVESGAVALVLELLGEDDASELEEDLALLLCLLAKLPAARVQIQMLDGITVLASVLETGGTGAQGHVVATLLQLAEGSAMGREIVRSEVTLVSVLGIAESCNLRTKAKANALAKLLRADSVV